MTVTNRGNGTFPISNANPVTLGYHWYDATGKLVVYDGARTKLPADLAAGQSVALQTQVTAPATGGTYTLRFDLVHEGIAWFSTKGVATGDRALVVAGPAVRTYAATYQPQVSALAVNGAQTWFSGQSVPMRPRAGWGHVVQWAERPDARSQPHGAVMLRKPAIVFVLIVAALALAATTPTEAVRPEWSDAGELARPRSYATAVALPSGGVIVVGGLHRDDPLDVSTTAEVVDARTGRTRLAGDGLLPRLNHTATLVRDRVIVVGGTTWRDGAWVASADVAVYSDATHAWTQGPELRTARSDHAAVVLTDGRLLVTGGNIGTSLLASTEIYDPRSDRWSDAAPMPRVRVRFSAARLPDGRVLVAGGLEDGGRPSVTTLLYDPLRDRWSEGPELAVPRVQHTAVQLPGGDVLLIGGQGAASNTAERYDVRLGHFVHAGSLVDPRLVAQAAALPDGRVVVSGGAVEQPGRLGWPPTTTAEIWDPVANAWSSLPLAPRPRALGALVWTPFGLLQLGGIGEREQPHLVIERLRVP